MVRGVAIWLHPPHGTVRLAMGKASLLFCLVHTGVFPRPDAGKNPACARAAAARLLLFADSRCSPGNTAVPQFPHLPSHKVRLQPSHTRALEQGAGDPWDPPDRSWRGLVGRGSERPRGSRSRFWKQAPGLARLSSDSTLSCLGPGEVGRVSRTVPGAWAGWGGPGWAAPPERLV